MFRSSVLINSLKDESNKRLIFPTSLMSEQVNPKEMLFLPYMWFLLVWDVEEYTWALQYKYDNMYATILFLDHVMV